MIIKALMIFVFLETENIIAWAEANFQVHFLASAGKSEN